MKIGILGTAASFHKAPFNDPSWELWACNVGTVPRWDRWFDLHDDASIDTYPGHRDFLTSQSKPVYTRQNYPLAAMKAKYGSWFFTSTIAYMLAIALESGPEEIGLWGVDMADASEYRAQKAGCRFFVQTALLQGIKVVMPPECEVAAPGRLYAFDGPSWLEMKATARKAELMGRYQENEARKTNLGLEKSALMGRLSIALTPEEISARLKILEDELQQAERDGLALGGAVQDIDHIINNWIGVTQ